MDTSQPLEMLKLLLPKLPLIVRVALLHVLRLSEPAQYLDLRSDLVVAVLRSFLAPSKPHSISATQRLTLKDPGIKGRIWVSKYTPPVPPETETGVRDALLSAIEGLSPPGSTAHIRRPEIVAVEAEWTAYRAGVKDNSALPEISEREKYDEMMKECNSEATVLYFHGGAYYLLDPSTHRPTTKKLARLTGGRCYSVRYRLAPQNPFPSALLDALASYLTLLYPPPEAFHQPVSPNHVVFAGDSAGGNLSLALLQTILELRRQSLKVTWFGQERDVPVPAGVAVNSPWLDMTLSSSSWERNARFDYLPHLNAAGSQDIPPCEAWPANPPRISLYVDDAYLAHPLVTLTMARSWKGAPPVYMCTGWELLADEDKFMAGKLNRDGATVVFEEYEAMPHCFAMILTNLPSARRCFDGWSRFVKMAVEDPESVRPSAVTVKAKTLQELPLDLSVLSSLADDEVRDRVLEKILARVLPPSPSKL